MKKRLSVIRKKVEGRLRREAWEVRHIPQILMKELLIAKHSVYQQWRIAHLENRAVNHDAERLLRRLLVRWRTLLADQRDRELQADSYARSKDAASLERGMVVWKRRAELRAGEKIVRTRVTNRVQKEVLATWRRNA